RSHPSSGRPAGARRPDRRVDLGPHDPRRRSRLLSVPPPRHHRAPRTGEPPMSTTASSSASALRLAVIAGDGIGQEVVPHGVRALRTALAPAGIDVETTDFDLGAGRWHRTGETLTDEDMARLAEHDAILLGAVGDPEVPSGVLERGLLLKLRFGFDHFVNL